MANYVCLDRSLDVQLLSVWSGLIMLATIAVGFLTKSFVMFGLTFTASIATSFIGMISVFSIVIMVSPNHSTSSSVTPKETKKFQEDIKVNVTIVSKIYVNQPLLIVLIYY